MLKKELTTAVAIAAFCLGASAGAQAPDPSDRPLPQQGTTATEPHPSAQAETTLTGCVYQEKDVPGRTPNVAERAGVLEDYILAVSQPTSPTGSPGTTPAPTGTSGVTSGSMYKLEIASDEELRSHVGKRVQVTGRIDAERSDTSAPGGAGTPQRDESLGRDTIELPEFEVSSIREVSGSCPAKPGGAQ